MEIARNPCYICKVPLTSENTSPSVMIRGYGRCNPCSVKRNKTNRAQHPKEFILYRVRQNAKVRGIGCSLTVADIPNIPEFCPVMPWIKLAYRVGEKKSFDSPSLDRIDNNLGYVRGNVRIISSRANELKSDATDKELIALGSDAQSRI